MKFFNTLSVASDICCTRREDLLSPICFPIICFGIIIGDSSGNLLQSGIVIFRILRFFVSPSIGGLDVTGGDGLDAPYGDGEGDGDGDGDGDGEIDGEGEGEGEGDGEGDTDGDGEIDRDGEGDTDDEGDGLLTDDLEGDGPLEGDEGFLYKELYGERYEERRDVDGDTPK